MIRASLPVPRLRHIMKLQFKNGNTTPFGARSLAALTNAAIIGLCIATCRSGRVGSTNAAAIRFMRLVHVAKRSRGNLLSVARTTPCRGLDAPRYLLATGFWLLYLRGCNQLEFSV